MSKGKATRSSTATSSTPAPAPTITNDILTGRFTEQEWNTLVEAEDGEEFVYELIETVVDGVLSVIHERHMDNNLIPHSLDWAENIMINLIDWQFLTHDTGESSSETANWLPDDEPERVPLDSWGRGSVPTRIVEEVEKESNLSADKIKCGRNMESDLLEKSQEDRPETEDLESIRRNPDLHKLNQLREKLKYYKINPDDIATLSKINKPSDTLHILYQALGEAQDLPAKSYEYEVAVASLPQTKDFIENFGPTPISDAKLARLKEYMDNIKLHPDHVTQLASPATHGLCVWLHTAFTYQTLCNVLRVETSIDLRTLKCSVIELKSLANPPRLVINVMCAVASLLSGKFIKDYKVAKVWFGDANILEILEKFDCKRLSQKLIEKLKENYMTHTIPEVKKNSMASSFLYQWCEDQIYGSGSIIIKPPEMPKKKQTRRRVKIIKHDPPEEIEADEFMGSISGSNNMLPHQSAAIVKAQQGRPPGKKDVQYDDKGNVISVMKINKLPSNRVRTTYEILEPNTMPTKKNKLRPLKGGNTMRNLESSGFLYHDTQDRTPVPPSFVDAVTASPGVVIKQGSKIKRGPDSVLLSPIDQNNTARYKNLLSSSS